jgi:hypothetical protein
MQLGHLLTRSGLTYPEVSSRISHNSFWKLLICYNFRFQVTDNEIFSLNSTPVTEYGTPVTELSTPVTEHIVWCRILKAEFFSLSTKLSTRKYIPVDNVLNVWIVWNFEERNKGKCDDHIYITGAYIIMHTWNITMFSNSFACTTNRKKCSITRILIYKKLIKY